MGNLDLGNGARIYFKITLFDGKIVIPITQTWFSLLAVTILLITLGAICGRGLKKRPGKRQVLVEKGVTMLYDLVESTMGKHNLKYAPYIGALFLSSICGSLIGMTQIFRSATADLMVTMAWALVTTALCWYEGIRNNGFFGWLKGFTDPTPVMTPMNIISEVAQPLSLALRHFGNISGGGVLTAVIYAALAGLSSLFFSWLPEGIAAVMPPIFQAGIPAFLSLYFDLFSGVIQAFVFSLLTMVYISSNNPPPAEEPAKAA